MSRRTEELDWRPPSSVRSACGGAGSRCSTSTCTRCADAFAAVLASALRTTSAHVVPFGNHLTGGTSTNTVYLGHHD